MYLSMNGKGKAKRFSNQWEHFLMFLCKLILPCTYTHIIIFYICNYYNFFNFNIYVESKNVIKLHLLSYLIMFS